MTTIYCKKVLVLIPGIVVAHGCRTGISRFLSTPVVGIQVLHTFYLDTSDKFALFFPLNSMLLLLLWRMNGSKLWGTKTWISDV